MKTYYKYTWILAIIVLVAHTTTYAQKIEKQLAQSGAKNIPTHFPLAKKDFKTVSSPFGYRKHPISQKNKMHSGIDLVAPKGTPVLATANGIVQKSAYQKGYGNYIVIEHFSTLKTLYAHLWIALVKKGDKILQGQIIGFVGDTGLATGPHLHYEVHLNNKKIDPLLLWKSILKKETKSKV